MGNIYSSRSEVSTKLHIHFILHLSVQSFSDLSEGTVLSGDKQIHLFVLSSGNGDQSESPCRAHL